MNALVEEAARHWRFVSPLLKRPATDADYDALAALLDQVLTITRGDPDHELTGLTSAMGDLIAAYDEEHRPMPSVSGIEALRYLMQEHRLGPNGLPEIGTAEAVAELLRDAGRLDKRQARHLGSRFGLPPSVFLVP